MEPEVILESVDGGPIAVHRGSLYHFEADPTIPGKEGLGELYDPTARWWLCALDLASRTSRRLLDGPVMRPGRLVVDDAGFALIGNELRFLDPTGCTTHVIGLRARQQRGIGELEHLIAFVGDHRDHDDMVCLADRRTGEVRQGVIELERSIGVLGAGDGLLAWCLEFGRALFVAPLADLTAVRRVELEDRIKRIWVSGGRILVTAGEDLFAVEGERLTRTPAPAELDEVWHRSPTWFGSLRGVTYLHDEEDERVSGGVVRFGVGLELVYSSALTGEDTSLGMGVENSIFGIAADEARVYFVERLGFEQRRLLALPTDAPVVERRRGRFAAPPTPEDERHAERLDGLASIFGRVDDLAPIVPGVVGVAFTELQSEDDADVWIAATNGLSDPGLTVWTSDDEEAAEIDGAHVKRIQVGAIDGDEAVDETEARDYELFIRRRGREPWAVELLVAVLRADLGGRASFDEIPVIGQLGDDGPCVLVHQPLDNACLETSYGDVYLLQVTPLTAEEVAFANRRSVLPGGRRRLDDLLERLDAARVLDAAWRGRPSVV